MLMRSLEILERNPSPTAEEVRGQIASNICRCTGYKFITEAVLDAADRLSADTPPAATEARS
jgi:carbon-monoxide dehydrogenase small subunit